jgi:hypothetical protein
LCPQPAKAKANANDWLNSLVVGAALELEMENSSQEEKKTLSCSMYAKKCWQAGLHLPSHSPLPMSPSPSHDVLGLFDIEIAIAVAPLSFAHQYIG